MFPFSFSCVVIYFTSVLILTLTIRFAQGRDRGRIFGCYRQEGKYAWFKFWYMYIILCLRKIKFRSEKIIKSGSISYTAKERDFDGPQQLKPFPGAIDAVYFNGGSEDGKAFACGLARRPKKVTNSFFMFWLNSEELLIKSPLPTTTVMQNDEEVDHFHAGGMKIDVVEPMKKWKLKFKGQMAYANNPSKMVDVDFDATWDASFNAFNVENMSSTSRARDLSREEWSRDYFEKLRNYDTIHFEQFGKLSGTITVDGVIHSFKIGSVRDHSNSWLRMWEHYRRYVLHFITLENGDCISFGHINMPLYFSELTIGFICKHDTKKIHPIDWSDFKLYQHAESKTKMPTDYAFSFKAGGEFYTTRVLVKDSYGLTISDRNEASVYERSAEFIVNGIKGWGITEWEYINSNKTQSNIPS